MSSPTPYVGSRISLISKAENRYEGTLYTIDTVNSTIALAKVRSFGTEDRPADKPILSSDEIFEYIIFRGSNIKDLTVVSEPPKLTSPLFQDPAIVQSSMGSAPSSTASIHSDGSYYDHFNREPVFQASHRPVFPPQFGIEQSAFGIFTRTAATRYHQGTTIGNALTSDSQSLGHSNPSLAALSEHPILRQATPSAPSSNLTAPVSMTGHNIPFYGLKARTATSLGVPKAQDGTGLRGATDARKVFKPVSEQARGGEGRDRSKCSTAAVGALQANHHDRGGSHRGQGRLRCDGRMKFEEDFDFESANARFNKKEKDRESRSKPEKVVNGEDKSVSSVPTQNSEEDKDGEPLGPNCYYDKSKSFFDQISSYDDTRKVNEKLGKWKQAEERRMNSETFNIPSRQNRSHGGCTDRGHSNSRSFNAPPHGGGSSFRGGYKSSQGDHRGFADLPEHSFREYRKDNKMSA